MGFEKYSTERLKKIGQVLLVISLVALVITCILLGFGIYENARNDDKTLLILVPTVFGPLTIFASTFATIVGSEVKKRQKANQ